MKKLHTNILLSLGMSLLAVALFARWPAIQPQLTGAHWGMLAVAGLGLFLSQFLQAGVWSQVLSSLGQRASFNNASHVWILSEALRWLPGEPFGEKSRVLRAKDLALTRSQVSQSIVLELSLTQLGWTTAASLLLLTPITHLVWEQVLSWLPANPSPLLIVGLLPPLLGLISVLVLRFSSLQRMARRLDRLVPLPDLQTDKTIEAALSSIGLCFFHGTLLWIVTRAVPGVDVSLTTSIGIAGAAWLAGFWLLGSPNSLGLRDAILIALLALYGNLDSAIAVSVLWRLMQGATELTTLLLARQTSLSFTPVTTRSSRRRFRSFRFLNLH